MGCKDRVRDRKTAVPQLPQYALRMVGHCTKNPFANIQLLLVVRTVKKIQITNAVWFGPVSETHHRNTINMLVELRDDCEKKSQDLVM